MRRSEGCAGARLDLVFVFDASTSLTEPNFDLKKGFVKHFLFGADIDGGNVRVGVVIYSDADYVQFQLNNYSKKAYVYDAIDEIPYRNGSRNTADALRTMRSVMFTLENGDRPGVDNVAVVVTDGVSNINSRRTVPEAEQARAEGIHIYAIGIGLTDTKELDGIASKPVDENRFVVPDLTELNGLREKVFSAPCKCFLQEDNTCTVKCPYKQTDRELIIYTL
ncbi:Collagen alpha-4(VI) chain [Bulinus truncatus]|nr:Collagen alpha-4(VI) chain [Bulinus truncatus]